MDFTSCNYTDNCKKYREGTCPIINPDVDQFCIKWFKIDELQNEALLTEKQKVPIKFKLDKDKTDKKAFDRLKEIEVNIETFVNNGENLYIYSHVVGNGKSWWSIRLLRAYFESIWYKTGIKCRGLFINVPKYFISLKDSFNNYSEYIDHIKKNVLTADLVVWDDIATKGFTEFEMESLLNIINNRVDAGKANIYTSNLAGEELKQALGDRLYSRVANMSEMIIFKSTDKRGILT